MRAVQQTEWGGPEVLSVAEIPEPVAGVDEVLVDVSAAGVNFADTHQRTNDYVAERALPFVPGSEVAGTRRDTGERVVALTRGGTGAYAEVAAAPADACFPIPDGLDDASALALLLQGLTAWHGLHSVGRVGAGETVVVVSGAGGVGSLAVQLGRPLGAGRVIATASSEDKRRLCLELGADAAVDGAADGLTERLLEANGGRPVDVVLEMAGGDVFEACRKALAVGGRLVVCGISSREQNAIRTGGLLKRSQTVAGFWLFHWLEDRAATRTALEDLFARAARGEVRAVAGGRYPLADARRAHEDLAARRTTGKLVLDPRA